jgi:hypothetical protein
MTTKVKKLIFLITIIYFGYAASLAIFSSNEAPTQLYHGKFFPYLADKPLSEDGFYMLTVAKNFANGEGFVYNFRIATSGVQPLSTVLYSVVFYTGKVFGLSITTVLRIIIFLSASLLYGIGFLLFVICKRWFTIVDNDVLFLLCIIFSAFNFEMLVYFSNGLETGIYSILVLLSVFLSTNVVSKNKYQKNNFDIYLIGILFGITSLARLDFVILSFAFGAIVLIKKKLTLFDVSKIFITQFIILLPWLLIIYGITGSALQSSVTAQSSWVRIGILGERLFYILSALMEHSTPLYFTMNRNLILIIGFILFAFYLFLSRKKHPDKKFIPENYKLVLIYWGTPFLLFLVSYLVYSYATYFYLRYTVPIALLLLPFFTYHFYYQINNLAKRTLFLITTGIMVIFFIHAGLYFHSGNLGVHQSLRVHYINTNFPPEEKIGVFQSGVTGFFCENVINLDGKIDNFVTEYRKANRFEHYLDSTGINVLIEWRELFPVGNRAYFSKNWSLMSNDIGDGKTVCYVRKKSNKE